MNSGKANIIQNSHHHSISLHISNYLLIFHVFCDLMNYNLNNHLLYFKINIINLNNYYNNLIVTKNNGILNKIPLSHHFQIAFYSQNIQLDYFQLQFFPKLK